MRTLLAVLVVCASLQVDAQCQFLERTPQRVEILQPLVLGTGSRTQLVLVRTSAGSFLRLPIPMDSMRVAAEGKYLHLAIRNDEGFRLTGEQLRTLQTHHVDTITLYMPGGTSYMTVTDPASRSGLLASANCIHGPMAPAMQPIGPAAQGEVSAGMLIARGGRSISTGAGVLLGGIAATMILVVAGGDATATAVVGGLSAVVGLVFLIDGGSKVSKGGHLMHAEGGGK